MAKRKKKRNSGRKKARANSGARWLEKQMKRAEELHEQEAYQEAFELLQTLIERYPRQPIILTALVDTAIQTDDARAVATYGEILYPMEQGEDRCITLNYLITAYMRLKLPALAWNTANILLANNPKLELRQYAEESIPKIERGLFEAFTQLDLLSQTFNADRLNMLNFMVEHDRMRFFAESARSKETIASCRHLLTKIPGFVPALNNMSLAYFMQGDMEKAISITQEVLTQQPESYHALSNLIRYSFLIGETDTARLYRIDLCSLGIDTPDRWLKQAEALAYLGDDEGVKVAYLQAEQHDWLDIPLFLHLAAAAHYRLGDESKAWDLWEEALQLDPSFYMAQKSLADREKEPHERDVGWYWTLEYWFTGSFQASVQKLQPKHESNRGIRQIAQKLLKQYPQFPVLAPHILDRSDSDSRQIMISLIQATERTDCLEALLKFGLSRQGTDDQRLEGLQFLSEHYPELLPANRSVSVWHRGKQEEILLLAFHVYTEPKGSILDDETYELYIEAYEYLVQQRHLDRAEELFMQVAKAYPDYPSVYNQLALIYEIQGNRKDARTLIEKTHARFPDYTFARMGLARMYLKEGRIDEARTLLNPVLQETKLHITELRTLVQAEMEFGLAMKRKDSARIWLDMWKSVEEDHPDIPKWKARIEGKRYLGQSGKWLQKLLRKFGL